jgi:Ca2+-transporting ATPase
VLLDDNFATIVAAIKEGRTIYDNLRQAFVFLFSFHIPIAGLAILPLLFGHSLFFYPIHIIFLELFCDPIAVLGFDRESPRRGLMAEPPHDPSSPLLNRKLLGRIFIQGILITAGAFGFYYYFGILKGDINLGRTMAFSTLVLSQIFFDNVFSGVAAGKKQQVFTWNFGFYVNFYFSVLVFGAAPKFIPLSFFDAN